MSKIRATLRSLLSLKRTGGRDGSGRHGKLRLSIVNKRSQTGKAKLRAMLLIAFAAVFICSAVMLIFGYAQRAKEREALEELAAITVDGTESSTSASTGVQILSQYKELYEQNPDMTGWIRIDGTVIDYPVMYTGDDFYLSHDFNKENSQSGVVYIDKRCTVEPFCTNTILYGHHMKDGTMFASLVNYADEDYYKQHLTICFDTLYEQQEYEIIAVFESQIYRENDTVFKHYDFLNAESQAVFDAYIANIKALSLYDTGVTACYGDELITLITCAYHTENGQFVVVARKIE